MGQTVLVEAIEERSRWSRGFRFVTLRFLYCNIPPLQVDNDFFVPHGYLSDDEGQEKEDEDEEENKEGNDEGPVKEKAATANRQNNQVLS